MNISGEVSFIDNKRGFVSVRWECADPPFINQPCFKFLEFPIYLFNNPEKGDTIIVIKVHK